MHFQNRHDAGKRLASSLTKYTRVENAVVLALPRGGVPVGYEIARSLEVPFDIFVVRKLGVPGHEELAMGAITSGGVRVINTEVVESMGISEEDIVSVTAREQVELMRREQLYGAVSLDLEGKIVILVDDGLATGSTMRAALTAVKQMKPRCVVIAVPVGVGESCNDLRREADDVICLATPDPFCAVGYWYHDFSSTGDEEIKELLRHSQNRKNNV